MGLWKEGLREHKVGFHLLMCVLCALYAGRGVVTWSGRQDASSMAVDTDRGVSLSCSLHGCPIPSADQILLEDARHRG